MILTALLIVCAFATYSLAFDGNDYGGSDWGGSDWGSSDWGGSDWSGSDWSYSSSGGSSSPLVTVIGVIVAILVILFSSITKSKARNVSRNTPTVRSSSGMNGAHIVCPNRTDQIENIIKAADPNFSSGDFITFTKQVYIDIQNAWCARDLTTVRPVLHENLYNTTNRQIQSKIQQHIVYHYESIAINTAYLTSYKKDAQFEYLTAYLNARMIDYQVDELTGNIIRGDKYTRWDLRYKMKFVRSVGTKTKEETDKNNGHNCPNCGAPMEISSSGVCDYCGSVVTTGQYSWVLTDFTTVRNDTQDEGIQTS